MFFHALENAHGKIGIFLYKTIPYKLSKLYAARIRFRFGIFIGFNKNTLKRKHERHQKNIADHWLDHPSYSTHHGFFG
jgi:hypothetical protein